jgi:hypothetical protein
LTVLATPAATPAATTHVIIVTQTACAEGICALVELNHELQEQEMTGRQHSVSSYSLHCIMLMQCLLQSLCRQL